MHHPTIPELYVTPIKTVDLIRPRPLIQDQERNITARLRRNSEVSCLLPYGKDTFPVSFVFREVNLRDLRDVTGLVRNPQGTAAISKQIVSLF
jgi:hypothetical protein